MANLSPHDPLITLKTLPTDYVAGGVLWRRSKRAIPLENDSFGIMQSGSSPVTTYGEFAVL